MVMSSIQNGKTRMKNKLKRRKSLDPELYYSLEINPKLDNNECQDENGFEKNENNSDVKYETEKIAIDDVENESYKLFHTNSNETKKNVHKNLGIEANNSDFIRKKGSSRGYTGASGFNQTNKEYSTTQYDQLRQILNSCKESRKPSSKKDHFFEFDKKKPQDSKESLEDSKFDKLENEDTNQDVSQPPTTEKTDKKPTSTISSQKKNQPIIQHLLYEPRLNFSLSKKDNKDYFTSLYHNDKILPPHAFSN